MNDLALASAITPIVAVIATSGVAVWTTRQSANLARKSAQQSANLARETRVQQRLGESYLDVLRIVEREGQWIEASIKNWKIAVEELATCGIEAVINREETGFKRVRMPPEPAATDRATIAAHLAAFGSLKVRRLDQGWRALTMAIDIELETVDFNWHVNYPDISVGVDDLKRLDELGTQELAARQTLADAVAEELGHR